MLAAIKKSLPLADFKKKVMKRKIILGLVFGLPNTSFYAQKINTDSIKNEQKVKEIICITNPNEDIYPIRNKGTFVKSEIYNFYGLLGRIESYSGRVNYSFYPIKFSRLSCDFWIEIPLGMSDEDRWKWFKEEEKKAPPPTLTTRLAYKTQSTMNKIGEKADTIIIKGIKEVNQLPYIEIEKRKFYLFYIPLEKDSLISDGNKLPFLLVPEKSASFSFDDSKGTMIFYSREGFYEFVLDKENSEYGLIQSDGFPQMIFDEKSFKKFGESGEILEIK